MIMSNKPDAVHPARALWLTIADRWRRVTDLERSMKPHLKLVFLAALGTHCWLCRPNIRDEGAPRLRYRAWISLPQPIYGRLPLADSNT